MDSLGLIKPASIRATFSMENTMPPELEMIESFPPCFAEEMVILMRRMAFLRALVSGLSGLQLREVRLRHQLAPVPAGYGGRACPRLVAFTTATARCLTILIGQHDKIGFIMPRHSFVRKNLNTTPVKTIMIPENV